MTKNENEKPAVLIIDVDGVMTTGQLGYTESGKTMKFFRIMSKEIAMNDLKKLLGLFFCMLLVPGCGGGGLFSAPNELPLPFKVVSSEENLDLSPNTTDESVADLVTANYTFAFDMYHNLRVSEGENLFFSPYSISLALSMVYAGARNDTAVQIESVMHSNFNPEDWQNVAWR